MVEQAEQEIRNIKEIPPLSSQTTEEILGMLRKDTSSLGAVLTEIFHSDRLLDEFLNGNSFEFSLGIAVLWKALHLEAERKGKILPPISRDSLEVLTSRQPTTEATKEYFEEELKPLFNDQVSQILRLRSEAKKILGFDSFYEKIILQGRRTKAFLNGFATYLTLLNFELRREDLLRLRSHPHNWLTSPESAK